MVCLFLTTVLTGGCNSYAPAVSQLLETAKHQISTVYSGLPWSIANPWVSNRFVMYDRFT